MCGERRVVTTAVFHMEHQRNIQDAGFKIGVFAVRAENMEQIFRSGQRWIRHMDIKAFSVVIMAVCLVAIYGKHRKQCDELQALTQNVRKGDVICTIVVSIEGQNAACERVHHVLAWCFQNNISDKAGRKRTISRQHIGKFFQVF